MSRPPKAGARSRTAAKAAPPARRAADLEGTLRSLENESSVLGPGTPAPVGVQMAKDATAYADPKNATWGLVAKPGIPRVRRVALEVKEYLEESGIDHVVERAFADDIGIEGAHLPRMDADYYITVGGDGTILLTLQHTDKPVYAINSGAVGFLAEVEPRFATSGLRRVMQNEFYVEERDRFKVLLDGERLPDAANEVTIQSARIAKLIKFKVHVDNELMDEIRGDGLIVATATGSTGYAMSLGGPILDPTIPASVIVPIAPFRMANRPMVVPSQRKVTVEIMKRESQFQDKDVKVVIDGQHGYGLPAGGKVEIIQSSRKSRFIRFGGGFYERVRTKLVR